MNCCEDIGGSKFSFFCRAVSWFIEMGAGDKPFRRLHNVADKETTVTFYYAPNLMSILQLVDNKNEILVETDGKREGVDFVLPSL